MNGRCSPHCLVSLLRFVEPGAPRNAGDMRAAIDCALACNRMIRCPHRLHCAWAAAELADSLARR